MAPDPRRGPGRERGRPGLPAHRVEGGGRRRGARCDRVLLGLRRDGGRASATGPRPTLALLSDDVTAFVLVAAPAPRRRRRGDLLRGEAARRRHPGAGAGRQPDASPVLATPRRARCASGPHTCDGTDLGGLYANLADFTQVAADEEEHLRRPGRTRAAGAGGARAVPAHRRARPRRPGRDRPPPLPERRLSGRARRGSQTRRASCRPAGRVARAGPARRRSTVSVTGTMRSKPVVCSRRVSVGRLQATDTSPSASRARRMPPMSAPRPAESMNGTSDRSISRRGLLASSTSDSRNWPTVYASSSPIGRHSV